jgi:hypothetical protein
MLVNGEPHTKLTVERLKLLLEKLRESEKKVKDRKK